MRQQQQRERDLEQARERLRKLERALWRLEWRNTREGRVREPETGLSWSSSVPSRLLAVVEGSENT